MIIVTSDIFNVILIVIIAVKNIQIPDRVLGYKNKLAFPFKMPKIETKNMNSFIKVSINSS
jgi:hypothetical protein